jgi:protein-tyrosine phosphatase
LIDLHCHLLYGIDDGAADLEESLEMARLSVAEGVSVIACTPHFFPGVYNNSGPDIRRRIDALQSHLDEAGIGCRVVSGGDLHVAPDLVAKLRSGEALSLNDSRYILVEPPHHILPPNIEGLFFNLLSAGYVPILTHPERMTWIEREYDLIVRLVQSGVWMQVTAGALLGDFGSRAKKWSLQLLREGLVHFVASDAHGVSKRPPRMGEALSALIELVGEKEALNLVQVRPEAIVSNRAPSSVAHPPNSELKVYEDDRETLWDKVSRYFRVD